MRPLEITRGKRNISEIEMLRLQKKITHLWIVAHLFIVCAHSWGTGCERGQTGQQGQKGEAGDGGDPGPGELLEYTNWKQCAWYSANGNDYDSNIYDCVFTKQYDDTALWVYYGGNLRVYGCSSCCKRWYITFNSNECSSPTVIDAVVYQENTNNMNLHRHRSFEGYCHNIGAGEVHVRLGVGDCSGYGNYDAETGWNSASRLIIKEVLPSPY